MLATLHSLDIPYGENVDWSLGNGFPKIESFISEVVPKLNLQMPNPEINGIAKQNGAESENAMAEFDEDSEENKILQTVSLFVTQYIQTSAASLNPNLYRLLPFLCQFIGTEKNQDISQACLKALCYLSVCTVQKQTIPTILDMISKLKSSKSFKTKLSMLEFLQVFLFTNFMLLSDFVAPVQKLILDLLNDERVQVRQKAAHVLTGLLHSQFIGDREQRELIKVFTSRIRTKMLRKGKRNFKKEDISSDKNKLANFHSGILGLCAIVEAYPYDVPDFVPDVLMELANHLHDPVPIPLTIKETMQEFKRTHQDNWEEHKTKFTEDQLLVMTDLLISPNYYA